MDAFCAAPPATRLTLPEALTAMRGCAITVSVTGAVVGAPEFEQAVGVIVMLPVWVPAASVLALALTVTPSTKLADIAVLDVGLIDNQPPVELAVPAQLCVGPSSEMDTPIDCDPPSRTVMFTGL